MSLDLDIFLQDKNLKNKLSFTKQSLLDDIEFNQNNVSLYYGLNWSGVNYSYMYAMNKYIMNNLNLFQEVKKEDIQDNDFYMIAYKDFKDQSHWNLEDIAKDHKELLANRELNDYFRFCFEPGSAINDKEKNILSLPEVKFLNTASVAAIINENKILLSGAISLLSLNYWDGSNNCRLRYTHENKYKTNIIYSKGKIKKVKQEKVLFVYTDEGRELSLLNKKEHFKEFMTRIDNALEILKNDTSYIGIKEHQTLEILKYFYTNKSSELYIYFC